MSGCWLWTGAQGGGGYGSAWNGQRLTTAHRAVYEFYVGPIPDGLSLDHLCRVRLCVNFRHVEPVSHRVNCLRATGVSALNAKLAACPRCGGEYETRVYGRRRYRFCRACDNAASRRRYAADVTV